MENIILSKKNHKNVSSVGKESRISLELIFIFYLALCSLKLTLFNFSIMNSHNAGAFLFKFILSFLITAIICTILCRMKSVIALVLFYLATEIYIFSNISYFSYFHNYLHLFQSAALFTEGVGQVAHFTIPVNYRHIVMLIDLPLFIYLTRNYSKVRAIFSNKSSYSKYILASLLSLIIINEVWNFANSNSFFKIIKDYTSAEPVIVERYGTIANNVCDVALNYGGKNLINHIAYGEKISNASTLKNSPNIIAIQVESMDSNIINKKYNGEFITPYLNELAKKNIYYPYVLSYHKAGGTSDSEFSIINSVEPLGNFPSIKISKYDYSNSMIKSLSGKGYSTFAFHGNIGNYYNRDVAFTKMGFKKFYDIREMGYKDIGWGAPDKEVFDYALKKIGVENAPTFSYIITLSSHTPFNSVANYYNNSNYDKIEDTRTKNYFNSFSYVDKAIYDLVNKVRAQDKNTFFFIWGDHTPDIDNEQYRDAALLDGNNFMEFVPLIIITPDEKNYIESKEVASFLDVAPTILETSGVPYDFRSDGKVLFNFNQKGKAIPLNEKKYDREELYKKISSQISEP